MASRWRPWSVPASTRSSRSKPGVDLIIAQGTEAGGHCGEVSTLVLVPEVLEAIAGDPAGRTCRCWPPAASSPDGRWPRAWRWVRRAPGPGSVWLTTEEAETAPHTVQKMLAATLAGHRAVGGTHGKAVAATGVGLDRRMGADIEGGAAAVAAAAAVDAGASPSLRRIDKLADQRPSGRAGAGDLLRRPGRGPDEQGQAGPRGGAGVHRGLRRRRRAARGRHSKTDGHQSPASGSRTSKRAPLARLCADSVPRCACTRPAAIARPSPDPLGSDESARGTRPLEPR